MPDLNDISKVEIRLFWFRRRILATSMIFAAYAMGYAAYFPLSSSTESQTLTYQEGFFISASALGGIGSFLYALPWKFPLTEWSYALLGWTATLSMLYFLFGDVGPFEREIRIIVGGFFLSLMAGAYSAHIIDGGRRKNENSLLLGPPP